MESRRKRTIQPVAVAASAQATACRAKPSRQTVRSAGAWRRTATSPYRQGPQRPKDRAMSIEAACQALRTGKVLELSSGGATRSVEVHAVGYTRQGHSLMR